MQHSGNVLYLRADSEHSADIIFDAIAQNKFIKNLQSVRYPTVFEVLGITMLISDYTSAGFFARQHRVTQIARNGLALAYVLL